MKEPPLESEYAGSTRWGAWLSRLRSGEFNPINYLIKVGALLILILLLVIAMQFALVDPNFRFGLLMLGLAIAAIVLVSRSLKAKGRDHPACAEDRKPPESMNPLQASVEELDMAFEGNPYSQMLALQELKELLVDRLVLRKHMSRSEIKDMASDPIWLEDEVAQPELRFLLSAELKGSYAPELYGSTRQRELISAFPNGYSRILELLEEM